MPGQASASDSAPAADVALRAAHERLVHDSRIQFNLPTFTVEQPTTPDWLLTLGRWIARFMELMAPLFQAIFWGGVGLLVLALVYMIARSVMGANWPELFKRKPKTDAAEPEWRPDAAEAKVLLEDADRLAAEGRFAEAAHLLLYRSLEDIREHRPRLVKPAVTSRELAVDEELPPPARTAFSSIAAVVESSFFGGRDVDAQGYGDCRRAYEEFAFPRVWA